MTGSWEEGGGGQCDGDLVGEARAARLLPNELDVLHHVVALGSQRLLL
jgi:hypothetical protein